MSKNQLTGTATQPKCNRIFFQLNKDQYCNYLIINKVNELLTSSGIRSISLFINQLRQSLNNESLNNRKYILHNTF